MSRVNVYAKADEYGYEEPELLGWFDPEKAQQFDEDTDWDGSNHISVATGSQFDHQCLYRTAAGRWVLRNWSQWQGSLPSWEFLADTDAREWLLKNKRGEAVERYFGEIEEEKGPGRPGVGGAVHVRLGDLLPRIDAYAAKHEISRAEAVRRLAETGLAGG